MVIIVLAFLWGESSFTHAQVRMSSRVADLLQEYKQRVLEKYNRYLIAEQDLKANLKEMKVNRDEEKANTWWAKFGKWVEGADQVGKGMCEGTSMLAKDPALRRVGDLCNRARAALSKDKTKDKCLKGDKSKCLEGLLKKVPNIGKVIADIKSAAEEAIKNEKFTAQAIEKLCEHKAGLLKLYKEDPKFGEFVRKFDHACGVAGSAIRLTEIKKEFEQLKQMGERLDQILDSGIAQAEANLTRVSERVASLKKEVDQLHASEDDPTPCDQEEWIPMSGELGGEGECPSLEDEFDSIDNDVDSIATDATAGNEAAMERVILQAGELSDPQAATANLGDGGTAAANAQILSGIVQGLNAAATFSDSRQTKDAERSRSDTINTRCTKDRVPDPNGGYWCQEAYDYMEENGLNIPPPSAGGYYSGQSPSSRGRPSLPGPGSYDGYDDSHPAPRVR